MNNLRGILGVVIVTISLCSRADAAISCYVCNSVGQQGCEDASRIGNFFQDCTLPGQDRCIKTVGQGNRVIRTCAGVGAPAAEGCLDNGGTKTCTCFSNYCNSANPFTSSKPTMTMSLFISIILSALCIL
ncbi:hypothetical protein BV898_06966 [Hypsibius exemplaris]|uniref:Protein sleepless n=1 Tax=Hypsibius exemplaris TaxID=2072580 RepID=A0A1W0WUM8_HYPEX|nr:hypothetical protein BV898_06966 [Hypsibius exemplaris]